jgi:hypothetical protein
MSAHHFSFGDNHRDHRDNGNFIQRDVVGLVNGLIEDQMCNSRNWNAPPPGNQQFVVDCPNIYPRVFAGSCVLSF